MKTPILIVVFSIFCVKNILAQNTTIAGFFPTIDHSGALSNCFSYNSYLFGAIKPYSSTEGSSRALYLYAENGLSYKITDKLSFTNSYVYERQQPFETNARNEHRLFQQLTLKLPFNKFSLKQRLRFDERFIQNIQTNSFDFSHRLRYLLGGSFEFNDNWYLMTYSEFFFNTTKGAKFQFNENWTALQIGYNINKKNAIEFGYLFVGWINDNQNNWFNQHYLQTTWVIKLNFNKHKNN